jgi:N-acetylglutamate synthase-like GNAT family acetyltransferase
LTIRKYKPADQEQVWALHVKTVSENDGFTKNLSFHTDMKDIQNVYETFFVLEKGDKIMGMIAMKKVDAKTAEIKRLQVNSDYQGEGHGKALLEAALTHLKTAGYIKLFWIIPRPMAVLVIYIWRMVLRSQNKKLVHSAQITKNSL